MFLMDTPDVPPQAVPIVIAEKSQATPRSMDRTIGVCQPIENRSESRLSAINGVSPVGEAYSYLHDTEHLKIDESVMQSAKMTLLQAPTHGELKLWDSTQTGRYFSSNYTYEGADSATVLVEIGGYSVKLIYSFNLMQDVPGSSDQGTATDNKAICPNGYIWKISINLDDSNTTVYAVRRESAGDRQVTLLNGH